MPRGRLTSTPSPMVLRFAQPGGVSWSSLYPQTVGRLTYTVRVGSLNGKVIGTYTHPGPDEPKRGTLLSAAAISGGPWRVSDYVQTDASAPGNNTVVVEPITD